MLDVSVISALFLISKYLQKKKKMREHLNHKLVLDEQNIQVENLYLYNIHCVIR